MMKPNFIDSQTFIGKTVTIQIDRPSGSTHPKWGFRYPLNYGFVPGVPAPDGEELDAYLIGVTHPVEHFTGKCIAVVKRADDDDDKLIVVPLDANFSDQEIMENIQFQEQFFHSTLIRGDTK